MQHATCYVQQHTVSCRVHVSLYQRDTQRGEAQPRGRKSKRAKQRESTMVPLFVVVQILRYIPSSAFSVRKCKHFPKYPICQDAIQKTHDETCSLSLPTPYTVYAVYSTRTMHSRLSAPSRHLLWHRLLGELLFSPTMPQIGKRPRVMCRMLREGMPCQCVLVAPRVGMVCAHMTRHQLLEQVIQIVQQP